MAKNNKEGFESTAEIISTPLLQPKVIKAYTKGRDMSNVSDAHVLEDTNPAEPADNAGAGGAGSGGGSDVPPVKKDAGATPPLGNGDNGQGVAPPPFVFDDEPGDNSGGASDPGMGGGGGSTPVPGDLGDAGSAAFADFVMDGFCMIMPKVMESYAAIDEKSVKEAEIKGDLVTGSLMKVQGINKNNKGAFKVDPEHRRFIVKPLEETLAIQGISAPPHIRLLVAVVLVVGFMWFNAYRLKMENKSLIDELKDMNSGRKRQEAAQPAAPPAEEKKAA